SGFANMLDYVLAGLGEWDDPYAARAMMAELGLDPAADPVRLSGGEGRRAALVRALSQEPDILLLDEPTNHLDLIAIEWLESRLASSRSALALISHDKRLLADLTTATVWLDRGSTRRLDRGFGAFEAWRDAKLEEEETERHKLDRRIASEEHWMRYGVTARRKRNMRRVDELADLRRERREARRAVGAAMAAQDAKASSALVIEAERIGKAYDGLFIVRDFSLRVMRRDRIGIVGANGAGKTTLLGLLTGALEPDSGSVRLGANVAMAALDQGRASLEPMTTLVDALTGEGSEYVTINGERRHVLGYMREFLFPPEQARTPIGKLSGGERGRLMLARALARPSSLMILDEPTNDLDIETLDLLQELLSDYAGTILLASHDRDFLDRVATSVIVAEGGGRWVEYAGGYSDMVAQRGYGLAGALVPPAAAEKPDRPPPERVTPKRKLSFNERRALEALPERMEKLRADLDELERRLADADFPAREPAAFTDATRIYGELRDALSGAEDEWLGLDILREELERQ
ncbi:MAG TPA: ATP-binding cassette domain-containing protein, partial [Roseiarcus sp.]|nr:ATP-binding cassette domain-containing protein [Roseiarcus sp.]